MVSFSEDNIEVLSPYILEYLRDTPKRITKIIEHILSCREIGLDLKDNDVRTVIWDLVENNIVHWRADGRLSLMPFDKIEEVVFIYVQHHTVQPEELIKYVKDKYYPHTISEDQAELMVYGLIEVGKILVGLDKLLRLR